MKRKNKLYRILKVLLILSIIAGLAVVGLNLYICASVKDRIVSIDEIDNEKFDCILVLGAGVRDDGSPSHMLEDRLIRAYDLYEAGASDYLLLSGDHGREGYDEVNTMMGYLMDKGVPREPIFMDHAGFSTYDSLYRAKEIFGAERIVIVTQEYHLYRALYIARSLGIDAIGVSANLRTYYGQTTREVREAAARTKDFFYAVLKPEPVILGEKIPLEGSGEVTDG